MELICGSIAEGGRATESEYMDNLATLRVFRSVMMAFEQSTGNYIIEQTPQ